jgi:hypothetical protein
MRNLTILLIGLLFTTVSMAQNAPIDFETGGYGASWTWNVFENDTNPPLQFVANPHSTGINTSATVAKFTALQAGNPWAGTESAHGTTYLGHFVLDTTNSLIKIKVWKTTISDVGIKLVSDSGWALPEIKIANTLVNQWEEISFDFSAYTNPPAGQGIYDQVVVFPDFTSGARTQTNVIYFDDITFNPAAVAPVGPGVAAPAPPVRNDTDVVSVFSGAYNDVAGTDFNPNWGQSTIVTMPAVQNDTMLKYANLNYQGTSFASALDVSNMGFLHVDMWTANATSVNIFCISTGPVETAHALAVTPNQWVSYDIPLTAFTNVNLADVIQLKVDGGTGSETVYFDNIYFYKGTATPTGPTAAAPVPPVRNPAYVVSVFSGAYANVAGTDFNPNWGQSTVVSNPAVQNDTMLKYETFNYQGTTFASALDVSGMGFLHLDMWTVDATSVNVFCISTGPVETAYALPITANQWTSYDIPLSTFTNVDLTDVIQFKFDGGTGSETIYLDNLYFYIDDTSVGSNISNDNTLVVFPNPVNAGQKVQLSADVNNYKVYDIAGKLVLNGNSTEFSTENLNKGMYLIVVENNNGNIQTQKLIVK